jgi:hypothetical protein
VPIHQVSVVIFGMNRVDSLSVSVAADSHEKPSRVPAVQRLFFAAVR